MRFDRAWLAVFYGADKCIYKSAGEKKPARGRFFSQADITSKQLEPKRLERQRQLEPKRLEQQHQLEPKRLERQRQRLERLELEQLLEQLLELEQQELLLFSSKQPEPRPAGRRSAGIFSWIFLS